MRTLIFSTLITLLVSACASGPADGTAGQASTTDFEVALEQINEPFLIGDESVLDFHYRISIANKTAAPVTLKRISLSTTGTAGPVRLETRSRPFDRRIAPGTTESVEFWTAALVYDRSPGHRSPTTVRVRTTTRDASGKDRTETFLRTVPAEYRVGNVL